MPGNWLYRNLCALLYLLVSLTDWMEVLLMIGIPGSGKTTLSKMLFPEPRQVSLDGIPHHDRDVEYAMIERCLREGHNVVIDDTNLTKKIRAEHIMLSKRHGARVNAFFLDLPMSTILAQNSKRDDSLPEPALFKREKELERPSEDEGFDFIQRLKRQIPSSVGLSGSGLD